MNLRIRKNVPNSLQINYHQVAVSDLPGVMGESLSNKRLGGIFTSVSGPTGIVVVFLILPLNKILPIVVLERSLIIQDLIDESVNELSKIFAINNRNQLFIELIYNVSAYEHCLIVILHHFEIITLGRDVFGNLYDVSLVQVLVLHQESISHTTFSKWLISNLNLRGNLTLLKERLLPVDRDTFILHNEPIVTD
jgi:hypothetical protein